MYPAMCKIYLFCNIFLMKKKSLEKLLNKTGEKKAYELCSVHFGRRQIKKLNLFFNETIFQFREKSLSKGFLKKRRRRMLKNTYLSCNSR